MISRRKFVGVGAAAGVGAMLPVRLGHAAEAAGRTSMAAPAVPGVSPPLAKFVDALPLPPAYTPSVLLDGTIYYDIPVGTFFQRLHRDLAPTYLWGYGGTYPSRSIEARVGQPIRVRWANGLNPGDVHPVAAAIDRVNIEGMAGNPDQRIITHLHGGHVPWTSDGGPHGWYTTGASPAFVGPLYNGDTFDYPNNQPGTTLWFHDHTHGMTRLNTIAGLAGFYLLRDPQESSLNLPAGAFEVPLAIQDRTFNADGSLWYPPPPAVPEFFGDTMLVNGKVWPFFNVEPRKYRFRFLNGCNARFLRMQLVVTTPDGAIPSRRFWTNVPFVQIGAEGGFFPAPTAPFNILTMGTAERADCIIDFSAYAGKSILLFNDAGTPFSNNSATAGAIPQVMLFNVGTAVSAPDDSVIPASFGSLGFTGGPVVTPTTPRRVVTLDETALANGMLIQLINQVGMMNDPFTGQPVPPDVAYLGTTEVWELVNTTVDTHPIHLHQTMFKVLERQAFKIQQYQNARVHGVPLDPTPFLRNSPPTPATPSEAGWKDTVQAHPGEVTRIAMTWQGYPGNYVYHCHILEHEEHDMMRAIEIRTAV